MASRKRPMGGGDNPEFVSRAFMGVSNNASRDMIGDEEFWWLENLIPLADGNLGVLQQENSTPVATLVAMTQPIYACAFTVGTLNYAFIVTQGGFPGSPSSGFIVKLSDGSITALGAIFAAGPVSATPYNNQGLLIISPAAYYDWNITTPGTLTNLNNTIQSATLTTTNTIPATSDGSDITVTNAGIVGGGPGTGALIKVYYQAVSVATTAGGTGYVIGDILTFTGGTPESAGLANSADALTIAVTQVNAGTIEGIQLTNQGSYAGPETGNLTGTTLPGGLNFTGGSGTGAQFAVSWQAIPASAFIVNPGTQYTTGATSTDSYTDVDVISPAVVTVLTLSTSGVIGGQTIAVFAERVWIGSQRTIFVTDVDSYNSFGGAGTNFTISDPYLHAYITALFSANNYLYIFGDTSVDALSNVQVTSGVTSFSRVNLTTSVGTSSPMSVFGYFRGVVFFHITGIYLLAGASPERISTKVQGVIRSTNLIVTAPSGAPLTVNAELCAVTSLNIKDSFYAGTPAAPVQRNVLALYFGGKWCFARVAAGAADSFQQLVLSVSGGGGADQDVGASVLYYVGFTPAGYVALYQAFVFSAPLAAWGLRTKLWDAGAPLREKQAIQAAVGMFNGALPTQNLAISVDTELASFALALPSVQGTEPYSLIESPAQGGGSQYLGLTVSCGAAENVTQLNLLALRGLAERDMLQ
jgi:hypothetical protein